MTFDVSIDTLAYGGSGVGRIDGKALFVPLSAPGDRLRVRIARDHKRHSEGEIVEILEPSPLRRQPPCPVFGDCGGCQWQHLPYEAQCRAKEEIFADTLRRRCALSDVVSTIVPSTSEWGCRSRVQFKCRMTESGFVMGFYRRESHYVIDVLSCAVAHPRVNGILAVMRRELSATIFPDRVPQVDVEVGEGGSARVVVHLIGDVGEVERDSLARIARENGFSLFVQSGRKNTIVKLHGEEGLEIAVDTPPLLLAYGAGGFAQVNLDQNRALVEHVLELARPTGGECLLDLFCGMGNFSFPLARRVASVVGVEDYAPSIAWARRNAERNGIENATFHAESACGAIRRHGGDFDLVLLDPPREGAADVVKDLLDARPARVVYVSCDPQTLARDLLPLIHGGYVIRSSRPFDLFPQTFHMESVTLLEIA